MVGFEDAIARLNNMKMLCIRTPSKFTEENIFKLDKRLVRRIKVESINKK